MFHVEQFQNFTKLLLKWQQKINLVSDSTTDDILNRHIKDSLQLIKYIPPQTEIIIDIGSGGGFPGIPLAVASRKKTFLIESDKRKSIFLQEAVRNCSINAHVVNERAEKAKLQIDGLEVVITIRAFANLEKIFETANSFLEKNNVASYRLILLKGKNVSRETLSAEKRWEFNAIFEKSETDEESSIVLIDKFKKK